VSELALLGGAPVRTRPWPAWPQHDEAERRAVLDVLDSGEWGGFPMPNRWAERFASSFALAHDCRHGLCVANGTVSLEIALQALGVEPGAEVVVPAYTFEATAAAVLFAGCVPVFADIDEGTYCLDPSSVESVLTDRTQAIVPVHLAMRFADMDRLSEIARRHGLAVLEDCAHAHGGRFRDRAAGSFGDAGSFSFQTSKLMAAGEGGIVVTDDTTVMDRLFALTNCGRQRPEREHETPVVGHNYRLGDFQAAILSAQLARLGRQHEIRNRNIQRLLAAIEELRPGIRPLQTDERITLQAAYQLVLRFDAKAAEIPRSAFVAALAAEGVPCDGHFYESLDQSGLMRPDRGRFPAFEGRSQAPCPHSARAAYEEAVWVPHHLFLGSEADTDDLADAILKVWERRRSLIGVDHPDIRAHTRARTTR
jgi:dTDP-4-amino-4,6-dideoxygalactose transaminase